MKLLLEIAKKDAITTTGTNLRMIMVGIGTVQVILIWLLLTGIFVSARIYNITNL